MNKDITLRPLQDCELEDFVKMNQRAFMKAVVEEYGPQTEEVIKTEDIIECLASEGSKAFNIVCGGKIEGGVVIKTDKETGNGELELLFVDPENHSKGIGLKVWNMIERMYPEVKVWGTCTPYFETRNIHFYVNKCGFHIVEFWNPKHPDQHEVDTPGGELFFRFEKRIG